MRQHPITPEKKILEQVIHFNSNALLKPDSKQQDMQQQPEGEVAELLIMEIKIILCTKESEGCQYHT